MAYDSHLADRVREYLSAIPKLKVKEKVMFSGVAFMVNGKMCVNVSGENLMCRIDPAERGNIEERTGFIPMIMKGKDLEGYCYVSPEGFKKKKDFEFWLGLCLDFNPKAKASTRPVKKVKTKKK